MRRLMLGCVGLLALLSVAPFQSGTAAQATTPIYRSNFNAPKPYGFHSWDDRVEQGVATDPLRTYIRTEILPGASPSGTNALRFIGIRNNGIGDAGWGGRFNGEATAPPQGAVRYARWRIRYVSPINWRSDSCANPPNCGSNRRTAPDKLFILGNTCENPGTQPTRIIYWQYAEYPSRSQPLANFSQNIGPSAGGFMPLGIDTWLNVQVEIRSSSSASASDGQLKVWVNQNDYASPNQDSGRTIPIRTAGWGRNTCASSHIVFGDGSYNPLSDDDPTTNAVVDIADFEYDDAFDPGWHIDGQAPPPPPPTCTFGPWSLFSTGEWSVCAGGTQTRVETWRRPLLTGDPAACGPTEETRTGTQTCTVIPPPPPPPPPVPVPTRLECDRIVTVTRNADYVNGEQRWTIRAVNCREPGGTVTERPPQN